MTEIKPETVIKTKILLSNLVKIFVFIFICQESMTSVPGDMDFSTSLSAQYFPQQKKNDLWAEATANWVYEFAGLKTQTKFLFLGEKASDYSRSQVDCQECYVQFLKDEQTFRLGWQVVHWGITDGYNPVNRINSRAYFNPIHPI